MFSDHLKSMIYVCTKISKCFGGSAFVSERATAYLYYVPNTQTRVNRNFGLAVLWETLSLILIYKRQNDKENLFLTTAYCLGHLSVISMYSSPKLYGRELSAAMNKCIRFWTQLKGIKDEKLDFHKLHELLKLQLILP